MSVDEAEKAYCFEKKLECPRVLVKYIIGLCGEMKFEIERETQTKIITHGLENDDDTVTVKAYTKEQLEASVERVRWCINHGRNRQPYTHVIAIPVANQEICSNYQHFKTCMLENGSSSDSSSLNLFEDEPNLNLSLLNLILLNEKEVQNACQILTESREDFSGACKELKFTLAGVSTDVINFENQAAIFTKVHQHVPDSLQVLRDMIREKFRESGFCGLVATEYGSHVTLPLNSGLSGSGDRSEIDMKLERNDLKNYHFGEFVVEKFSLMERSQNYNVLTLPIII